MIGLLAGAFGVDLVLIVVLSLAGMLAFCVGIYFVIPIIIAGNVLAYRKVFPAPGSTNVPPAPNAFQDAGTFR
ncbi:MAG: hypothetical protein IPJ30_05230 [Acidobacteria bacterium]|nr:hypothetical protein [Acidobacteriota bacterium]